MFGLGKSKAQKREEKRVKNAVCFKNSLYSKYPLKGDFEILYCAAENTLLDLVLTDIGLFYIITGTRDRSAETTFIEYKNIVDYHIELNYNTNFWKHIIFEVQNGDSTSSIKMGIQSADEDLIIPLLNNLILSTRQ